MSAGTLTAQADNEQVVTVNGQKSAKTVSKLTFSGDNVVLHFADGSTQKLDMPDTSNVLQWFCNDGTKVSVRPSGTEPKIKFYLEVKGTMKCEGCYERCMNESVEKIAAIKKSLGLE